MDGGTGEEECGVNEEKSRGEFRNEVLAFLIRIIYTAVMWPMRLVGIECWGGTTSEESSCSVNISVCK